MKTILQALKDELNNAVPILGDGKIGNIVIVRGLDPDAEFTAEVYAGNSYTGARADCLFALVSALEITESDISLKLADRSIYLKMANRLYASIGEPEKTLDQPTVRIGPPSGIYVYY